MNRTEYDLAQAAKDRRLKTVELIDFDGRTVQSFPWQEQFVSFKAFKHVGAIYRFGFVFNWTVYYQRTGVLDTRDWQPVIGLNE